MFSFYEDDNNFKAILILKSKPYFFAMHYKTICINTFTNISTWKERKWGTYPTPSLWTKQN